MAISRDQEEQKTYLEEGHGSKIVAARISAQHVLRQKAELLRHQANQLEALADSLPVRMSESADEALRLLLNKAGLN